MTDMISAGVGSVALALSAAAFVCWPSHGAVRRIRPRRGPSPDRSRLVGLAPVGVAALLAAIGMPWWIATASLGLLLWLRHRSRSRAASFGMAELRGAAAILDLLAVGLRSGRSTAVALRDAVGAAGGEQFPGSLAPAVRGSGRIATALADTAALLALGAGAEAAWQPIAQCQPISELAAAGARSQDGGLTLADAAREIAERLRAKVRADAARRAARAGVAIAAPLTLCFLPAFVLLGLAPVVISLAGALSWW